MKKVAFLIPASPNASFFAQIAAFRRAIDRLQWTRWRPSVHAYFGGVIDIDAFAYWRDFLSEVELNFLPQGLFKRNGFFAQGDARFINAPRDADVVVMMDADTFAVGSLEEILDEVLAEQVVAGLIAHYPFPARSGRADKAAWREVAEGLIKEELQFSWRYTLMEGKEDGSCPFYVNFGVLFMPSAIVSDVFKRLMNIRRDVAPRLSNAYFSAQVGLALAVADMRLPTLALSMAYNFPNDPIADRLHPGALADVRIFHYLRTDRFDRQNIFTSRENYRAFLELPLSGSNAIFQNYVRRILGDDFIFEGADVVGAI